RMRTARWQLLVVPLGALVAWQCAVPAPQFHGDIMKVSADSINDYIASLQFAPDTPHAQRQLVDFVQWRLGTPGHGRRFTGPEYPELSARFSPDYDGLWGRCNSSCCATSTAAADTLGTE